MDAPTFLRGFALALSLVLVGGEDLAAEEARAAVYVVDRSPEFAETGGGCLPYSPAVEPGPARAILALATAPAGSTIVMAAFDGDAPHRGLAPVVAEQGAEGGTIRFPGGDAAWPFEEPGGAVDLYIAVFDKDDPGLAKVAEGAGRLAEALASGKEVEALLHSEAVKARLNELMRRVGVQSFRVDYGADPASLREAAAPKAATTRSPTAPKATAKRGPSGAARPFESLEAHWREDARAISFGLASPGALVFPIAKPAAP
jgi:hypothetical protein